MQIIMVVVAMLAAAAPRGYDATVRPASLVDHRAPSPPGRQAPRPGLAFPSAVPDIYATMDEDSARQQTCMDQYIANAATGSNGKLIWDEYYARCDDRLIR
jgi:hypothetical protein